MESKEEATETKEEQQPQDEDESPLSPEQQKVVDLILAGKSLLFTGPAGTGKTRILKQLTLELEKRGKLDTAYFTATTGIAALNIGGTTLHKFVGCGLINKSVEEHVSDILNNPKNYYTKMRWVTAKLLIVDEVSMLSGTLLDKISKIAKGVRGNNQPFGNIQVVLCGDFFQLPPIPESKKFRALYVFESDTWGKLIKRVVVLREVFRQQTDPTFVTMLNEIREGVLSPQAEESLRRITIEPDDADEEDSDGIVATRLFAKNLDVDALNNRRLEALPGQELVYEAVDRFFGKNLLKKEVPDGITVPKTLKLKVGAQVMLTCNINVQIGLCNGTRGVVKRFHNALPVVKFDNDMEVVVTQLPTEYEDRGKVVFKRTQLPLRLAWAVTIHKSQGMTISRLVVDCRGIFENGQFYVAISRAKSLDGLKLIGFEPGHVKACRDVCIFYGLVDFRHEQIRKRQADAEASGEQIVELDSRWDEDWDDDDDGDDAEGERQAAKRRRRMTVVENNDSSP